MKQKNIINHLHYLNNLNSFCKYQKSENFHYNPHIYSSTVNLSLNLNEILNDFQNVLFFGMHPDLLLQYLEDHKLEQIDRLTISTLSPNLNKLYYDKIKEKFPLLQTDFIKILEEDLLFEQQYDLIISNYTLQFNNNLYQAFDKMNSCLKKDGCIIGNVLTKNSFYQLRNSLYEAENLIHQGYCQRVFKLPESNRISSIIHSKNFEMVTVHRNEQTLDYQSIEDLYQDLKNNALRNTSQDIQRGNNKSLFKKAKEIYQKSFSKNDQLQCTYETSVYVGYKQHQGQLKKSSREFHFNQYYQDNKKEDLVELGYIDDKGDIKKYNQHHKINQINLSQKNIITNSWLESSPIGLPQGQDNLRKSSSTWEMANNHFSYLKIHFYKLFIQNLRRCFENKFFQFFNIFWQIKFQRIFYVFCKEVVFWVFHYFDWRVVQESIIFSKIKFYSQFCQIISYFFCFGFKQFTLRTRLAMKLNQDFSFKIFQKCFEIFLNQVEEIWTYYF